MANPKHHFLTRRDVLQTGMIGLGGLSLAGLLQLQQSASGKSHSTLPGKAKSVVMLFLSGGPAHQDMWDMKPEAPEEIRGTFKPIETNVPGIQICEHMPRMAKLADKYAIIRSLHHSTTSHPAACYWMMVGNRIDRPVREANRLSRLDRPHVGSALAKVLGPVPKMPPFVMVPEAIQPNGPVRSGQYAGLLGAAYDPYLVHSDPSLADYSPGAVRPLSEMTASRIDQRQRLLSTLDHTTSGLKDFAVVEDFGIYHHSATLGCEDQKTP